MRELISLAIPVRIAARVAISSKSYGDNSIMSLIERTSAGRATNPFLVILSDRCDPRLRPPLMSMVQSPLPATSNGVASASPAPRSSCQGATETRFEPAYRLRCTISICAPSITRTDWQNRVGISLAGVPYRLTCRLISPWLGKRRPLFPRSRKSPCFRQKNRETRTVVPQDLC